MPYNQQLAALVANMMVTYGARWVFPVDGPPLEGGSVTVAGERIVSVQAAGPRKPDVDLGNVALLPGFVNAHTHLDLCGAHGRCPPTPDFTKWLRQVIEFRRQRTPDEVQADIAAGIAACLLSGTTLVGDIASGGASWDLLSRSPIRATVYYELIGLSAGRANASIRELNRWLGTHQSIQTCHVGLSPHAPYSVHRDTFRRAATIARLKRMPVAIHLAETPEETELLQHRAGPFVAFLQELGVWEPEGLVSGPEEIAAMFRDSRRAIFIHANHVPPNWSQSSGNQVVVCPRTSYRFGRGVGSLARIGVAHALGTDSLASNPDLDILAEARFVYRERQMQGSPEERRRWLLSLLTRDGAEALGWQEESGTLTLGKSADMVVLPLPERDADDPHDLIFDSDLAVRAVMFRGAWVVGEGAIR